MGGRQVSAVARFRQVDVTRALKGAEAAGFRIGRIEIDRDGKIVILSDSAPASRMPSMNGTRCFMGKPKMFPDNVTAYRDRHGKLRLRFRKKGLKPYTFKSPFGTKAWDDELAVARRADQCQRQYRAVRAWVDRRSDSALLSEPRLSRAGRNHASSRTGASSKAFRSKHGTKKVATVKFAHIDAILAEKASTHPFAAKNLRKQLLRLFTYAEKAEMIDRNPVQLASRVKAESSGFYTWTEDDIAAYQATHPLGTAARLALELMLWTGCRRSDAVRMGKQHLQDGIFTFQVKKSKNLKTIIVPCAPMLAEAIMAMPKSGHLTLLLNAYNRPFSAKGFGERMRKWCDAAGLPDCTAHGLRKAISRRMAEMGAGNQGIKSVTGHSGDAEVALYTREVDQKRLAQSTMTRLVEWEMANRNAGLANDAPKPAEKRAL
jgi:integrase